MPGVWSHGQSAAQTTSGNHHCSPSSQVYSWKVASMRSSAWGFEAFQAYQTLRFGPAAFCLIGGIDQVAALASIATLDGGSRPPGSRTLSRDRAYFRRLSFEYF